MAISIIYLSCLFLTLVIQLSATSLVSNTTTTWQEAVTFCSREGMILRKERLGVDEKRSEKFWTRIYEKEHFVYLFGCFNATDVLMYNVSAAQCPGKCLRQEPFMFALSGISKDKCTCVYDSLPQAHAGQCVNSLHILVFGVHDTKSSEDNCVRLECEGNTSRLTHVNCDERENLVCNNEISPGNFTWRNAAEKCLQNSGRLSDVNFKTFCQTYNTSAWFGFGTVISEEEYDTNKDDTDLNPKRCQSCAESCMFEDCNTQRITSCETETVNSENKSVTLNVSFKTTTSLSILSTSDMITTEEIISTGETNKSVDNVMTYIISSVVSAILIVMCVCFLYIRRKSQKQEIVAPPTVREELYELADISQLENADNGQVQVNNGLSTSDSTTPGSVHGEDIYNHLWERTTEPGQDEESVYNRCINGKDENSTYDVTVRKLDQIQTEDAEYHHVMV